MEHGVKLISVAEVADCILFFRSVFWIVLVTVRMLWCLSDEYIRDDLKYSFEFALRHFVFMKLAFVIVTLVIIPNLKEIRVIT
jgi:hypothetical protein